MWVGGIGALLVAGEFIRVFPAEVGYRRAERRALPGFSWLCLPFPCGAAQRRPASFFCSSTAQPENSGMAGRRRRPFSHDAACALCP